MTTWRLSETCLEVVSWRILIILLKLLRIIFLRLLTLPLLLLFQTMLDLLSVIFSTFLRFPTLTLSRQFDVLARQSVCPDEILSFITWGCTDIFALVLRRTFNISFLRWKFPTSWKQAAVMPLFKKGNSAVVTNYRLITILNYFSRILRV